MVVFKVITRRVMRVGEKKERLHMTIIMGGVEVQSLITEPYGMTRVAVQKLTEDKLTQLRQGLTNSGVNSSVIREEG